MKRMQQILMVILAAFVLLYWFGLSAPINVVIRRPPLVVDSIQDVSPTIVIVIDAADQIAINGRNVDERAVAPQIRRFMAEDPESRVELQAHSLASAATLTAVIKGIKAADEDVPVSINELQN
jgi:biopolymer transport protein ExbD